MNNPTYALDNYHPAAAAHHRALGELLDPHTTARIRALRDPATLTRCLDVGAGGGSLSLWLADHLGDGGEVLALDVQPDLIGAHPRVAPVAWDLQDPTPLVEVVGDRWDLIVSRMTLMHLPARRTVLHQLAGMLAPGGVLLVEDWQALHTGMVVAAPSPEAGDLYERFQRTLGKVFAGQGADRTWAQQVHPAMIQEGLDDVDTLVHATFWTHRGPGLRLASAALTQLRQQLLNHGLTESDLAELEQLLDDPVLIVHGHPLYSTAGRRRG